MMFNSQNIEPDLKKMLLVSVAFHIALILLFTVKAVIFPSDIPKYEPVVRVDLVGLPDKRDPDKPLTAPAQEKPREEAPVVAAKPEEKKAPTPTKTETKKNSQADALNKLKALSAIEKLKSAANTKPAEKTTETKSQTQTEVIKGNVISPGTALKGLNKIEFDQYIGSLDAHVKNNWALPEWMLAQNFRAEVTIRIDRSGQIIERKLVKKSGNSEFDDRVMSAIEKSNPFPAPPDKFIDLVGIQGITFAFPE